jgi:hypothetical protein
MLCPCCCQAHERRIQQLLNAPENKMEAGSDDVSIAKLKAELSEIQLAKPVVSEQQVLPTV